MAPRSKLDTSYHDRRLARRRKEAPEFQAEFERQRREIGKEPSSIRRLFTADVNPELKTVAAIADALGAEVKVVDSQRVSKRQAPHAPGLKRRSRRWRCHPMLSR
jgi:hypothetical protein